MSILFTANLLSSIKPFEYIKANIQNIMTSQESQEFNEMKKNIAQKTSSISYAFKVYEPLSPIITQRIRCINLYLIRNFSKLDLNVSFILCTKECLNLSIDYVKVIEPLIKRDPNLFQLLKKNIKRLIQLCEESMISQYKKIHSISNFPHEINKNILEYISYLN